MSKNHDEHTEAVLYNPEITAERLKSARPFKELFPKLTAKLATESAAEAENKCGRPRQKPQTAIALKAAKRKAG